MKQNILITLLVYGFCVFTNGCKPDELKPQNNPTSPTETTVTLTDGSSNNQIDLNNPNALVKINIQAGSDAKILTFKIVRKIGNDPSEILVNNNNFDTVKDFKLVSSFYDSFIGKTLISGDVITYTTTVLDSKNKIVFASLTYNVIDKSDTFLANTDIGYRTGLLEKFTGCRLGYGPDADTKAESIQNKLGKNKIIIVSIHGGSYASPSAGWPNFTSPYGDALINQSSVLGYPAGTLNRISAFDLGVTPQISGGMAISRQDWEAAALKVNTLMAPVNIGAKAVFNSSTRELKIKVDMYYGGNETNNSLNIALIQDKLMSKQSGATTNPYEQNHVFRNLITGQWGAQITEQKTIGAKLSKSFVYDVPFDFNGTSADGGGSVIIENCKIVVFITRDKVDVLNALEIPIQIK